MKLYSQEGFLYRIFTKASREKDLTKVDVLGPYASHMRFAIMSNGNRRDVVSA